MSFGDEIDWDNEARRAAADGAMTPLFEEHVRALIEERIRPRLASGFVLDCGCNIGRYCRPFVAAGYKYVGVDQSAVALEIARERHPDSAFVRSFLWDMEFEAHPPFDMAMTMAVLQHNLLDEKRRILDRIAFNVVPGGLFLMNESTVIEETRTQLRHDQWIELVGRHGFELIETWHPNPEYGVNDAYLFRRL